MPLNFACCSLFLFLFVSCMGSTSPPQPLTPGAGLLHQNPRSGRPVHRPSLHSVIEINICKPEYRRDQQYAIIPTLSQKR